MSAPRRLCEPPVPVRQLHPAVFARMSPAARTYAIHEGTVDGGIDWRVWRVADLVGVDAAALEERVEVELGWEPHDTGFLAAVVRSAGHLVEERKTIRNPAS